MAKPGPKPKPTALRIFEGNPGRLPLPENEPKPEKPDNLEYVDWLRTETCEYMSGDGKFPLSNIALKIWDELSVQLDALGILTSIDMNKFGRYCETFSRWLKMKAFIDKNGETYPIYGTLYDTDSDGVTTCKKVLKKVALFPQVGLYVKLAGELRKYEEEFGIGAASRTRIQTIVKLGNAAQAQDDHDFDYASKDGHLAVVK